MLAQVAPGTPEWLRVFQEGYGPSISLILILALSVAFGVWVARSARMEDAWWRYTLVLGSLLLGLLCVANKWPPKLGVDLKGGAMIVGEFDPKVFTDSANMNDRAARERFIQRLKQRIDPSGTREIVIRLLGQNKIEVIIPAVDRPEAERLWKRMTTVGYLQFRMLSIDHAIRGEMALEAAIAQNNLEDELKRREREVRSPIVNSKTGERDVIARWYDIGRVDDDSKTKEEGKPAHYRYFPFGNLSAKVRDGATGRIIPIQQFTGFAGSYDQQLLQLTRKAEEMGISDLQVLMMEPDEKSRVDGEHIRSVRPDRDRFEHIVSFVTNSQGTNRMARLTSTHKKKGNKFNHMGIILDKKVMSAPRIDSPITHGNGMISGGFTERSAKDLVIILNAGKTSLALKKDYNSMETIQSSLGEEMKQKGIYAITISLFVVLIFMAVYYYQFAGLIACFALLMNMVLVAGSLFLLGQPITLTGLAGFVLTVGMSVDANVLVFERIREEIDKGTSLRLAIRNGFDRATTTIVDANLTTLLTAVVLYVIGHEQIKSFAIVLILGILTSMFTAIFVSRSIFDYLEHKRLIKSLNMMRIFKAHKLPVTNWSKIALSISSILIIIGLVATFVRGAGIFDYDLRGGSTASVVFSSPMKREDILNRLDGKNLKMGKETASFYVSPLESDTYDSGTYFKVESTLRGEKDAKDKDGKLPEGFKTLKQVLQDEFGDNLRRLDVKASEVRFDDSSAKKPAEKKPAAEAKTSSVSPASFKPVYASISMKQEKDDKKQEEAKKADAKQDAKTVAPTSIKPATVQPAQKVDQAAKQGEKPAGTVQADPKKPAEQKPEEKASLRKAFFDLEFTIELLDESVKGQVIAAAESIDVPMDDDRITVKTESGLSRDTKFTVSMIVSNANDAQRIVETMTKKLNSQPFFPQASEVGGQIAGIGQQQALLALIISLIGIILYIWFRFQHIWFGFAAVVALIHDVLFVIGAIALSYWLTSVLGILKIDNFKISLQVVGALLTVVGYSLNDTIVVFDRIREVRGRSNKFTSDMIDISIGQTLSRTILTSFTTFLVVFILFGWGGASIHAFAFALTVGVIVGTFSSVFVASPVLLWLMKVKPIAIDPIEPKEEAA